MIKKISLILIILAVSLFIFTSCGDGEGDKGKVELVYVAWDSEIASTNVVKAVLQEKMGYDVTIKSVDAAIMWETMGQHDADAMVAAWLPGTHGDYYAAQEDKVELLGANLDGAKIGLVVPTYVTIDSIGEINEHADKFNGEITGIDPGAGIMKATEKAIDAYDLDNMKLTSSADAVMTATLKDRYADNEWVVVTGWTPHWKFAKYDLKYLDDPQGIYGGEEYIGTVVRPGLKEDMPDVYEMLDNFYWSPDDMAEVMVWIQEGMDPYEAAKQWIRQNEETVDEWIPED